MQYQKTFDIHSIPGPLRKHIQPGQHVYASAPDAKGIYLGQTKAGTDVCLWIKSTVKGGFNSKRKVLREYALNNGAK